MGNTPSGQAGSATFREMQQGFRAIDQAMQQADTAVGIVCRGERLSAASSSNKAKLKRIGNAISALEVLVGEQGLLTSEHPSFPYYSEQLKEMRGKQKRLLPQSAADRRREKQSTAGMSLSQMREELLGNSKTTKDPQPQCEQDERTQLLGALYVESQQQRRTKRHVEPAARSNSPINLDAQNAGDVIAVQIARQKADMDAAARRKGSHQQVQSREGEVEGNTARASSAFSCFFCCSCFGCDEEDKQSYRPL